MNSDKAGLLKEVAALLNSQEHGIQQHPPETGDVYRKGRDAFLSGQQTATEEPWMRAAGLTLSELALLRRYMLSCSFISAWYHVHGDKAQRDKAAHSCAILVSGFGEDPEEVMRRYIEYEKLWRQVMKAEGIAPPRIRTASALAIAYPLGAGLWMSTRAPLLESLGFGITQLGYLVAFSGLLFGSFQVLGLRSRWRTIAAAIPLWLIGVVLVNL